MSPVIFFECLTAGKMRWSISSNVSPFLSTSSTRLFSTDLLAFQGGGEPVIETRLWFSLSLRPLLFLPFSQSIRSSHLRVWPLSWSPETPPPPSRRGRRLLVTENLEHDDSFFKAPVIVPPFWHLSVLRFLVPSTVRNPVLFRGSSPAIPLPFADPPLAGARCSESRSLPDLTRSKPPVTGFSSTAPPFVDFLAPADSCNWPAPTNR